MSRLAYGEVGVGTVESHEIEVRDNLVVLTPTGQVWEFEDVAAAETAARGLRVLLAAKIAAEGVMEIPEFIGNANLMEAGFGGAEPSFDDSSVWDREDR